MIDVKRADGPKLARLRRRSPLFTEDQVVCLGRDKTAWSGKSKNFTGV
jgi:hypothetical protein